MKRRTFICCEGNPCLHGSTVVLLLLIGLGTFASCRPKPAKVSPSAPAHEEGALFSVGSIVVYQADLDRELEERHVSRNDEAGRKKVLDELAARAQLAQAGVDEGLLRDPVVRAQVARVLASQLKEKTLVPRLKEKTAVPEARLRELYQAEESRFRSPEKRQVAVLWLNPNDDPERRAQYERKLAGAREWFFQNADLKNHPEQGFSALSVDHSEHAGSRFKGGVIDWLGRSGGMDAWSKAVAEIGFSLNQIGDVSEVISRPEGVFLVRYMAVKPAVLRPFESVAGDLERLEQQRIRAATEAEFDAAIKAKHPIQWFAR